MWNDITLTSLPGDVPRADCKEGGKMPSLINQNTASRSRSDENERSGTSADDAKEAFTDVTFGIALK